MLKRSRSSLPFPRRPSSEEKAVLQRVFEEKLINEYVLEWTFDSWSEVMKGFNKFISIIRSGRNHDLRDGKIEPPCKVSVPWKTIEEAAKHYFAIFVHNKEKGGINKIIEALKDYKWAKFEVERDKALRIIVQS